MDKGEIARDYARSKNHKRQIQILAELNACPKEKVIEILREKGYKMVFNTNGVDISLKYEEIHAAYQDGKTTKELSKQYHVSAKGIREILGIVTEDEVMSKEVENENISQGMTPEAMLAEIQSLTAENRKLREKIRGQETELCELRERVSKFMEDDTREKYQQVCIRNSQLNATIDTLIDKISMLKAVGCNGR